MQTAPLSLPDELVDELALALANPGKLIIIPPVIVFAIDCALLITPDIELYLTNSLIEVVEVVSGGLGIAFHGHAFSLTTTSLFSQKLFTFRFFCQAVQFN